MSLPLRASQSHSLFKFFSSDVGLLTSSYGLLTMQKILQHDSSINIGAIFENFAAQELKAHGYSLFYYNSKKTGKLDFVLSDDIHILPIEMKSGKDAKTHRALDLVIARNDIPQGYVFYTGDIVQEGKITYYPTFLIMFLNYNNIDDIKLPNLILRH